MSKSTEIQISSFKRFKFSRLKAFTDGDITYKTYIPSDLEKRWGKRGTWNVRNGDCVFGNVASRRPTQQWLAAAHRVVQYFSSSCTDRIFYSRLIIIGVISKFKQIVRQNDCLLLLLFIYFSKSNCTAAGHQGKSISFRSSVIVHGFRTVGRRIL